MVLALPFCESEDEYPSARGNLQVSRQVTRKVRVRPEHGLDWLLCAGAFARSPGGR